MSNISWLSIFFVTDILLYLPQGGRKTAFVENIYTRSRLRERQMALNIEKRWIMWTDFLHFLPFLWKGHLRISYRVATKRHLKHPKKNKKSLKKHLKNKSFEKEKKIKFSFSFFYRFKKKASLHWPFDQGGRFPNVGFGDWAGQSILAALVFYHWKIIKICFQHGSSRQSE